MQKKQKKDESQSIQKELLTSLTSLALWLSAATVVHAPTGHTSLLSASLQALESHISLLDFLPSLSLQLSHVCSQLWVKMNWVCWVNSLIVLYETKTYEMLLFLNLHVAQTHFLFRSQCLPWGAHVGRLGCKTIHILYSGKHSVISRLVANGSHVFVGLGTDQQSLTHSLTHSLTRSASGRIILVLHVWRMFSTSWAASLATAV